MVKLIPFKIVIFVHALREVHILSTLQQTRTYCALSLKKANA